MFKRIFLLSSITLGMLATSQSLLAADREVNIINKTKVTLVSFYASNSKTKNWEEDILDDDMLEPNESILIDIDDGTGACKFDFRGVFEDGEEVIKHGINVCKVGEFRFTQ